MWSLALQSQARPPWLSSSSIQQSTILLLAAERFGYWLRSRTVMGVAITMR
jgi:hypothetical protein